MTNFELHRPDGYSQKEVSYLTKMSAKLYSVLQNTQDFFVYSTLKLSSEKLQDLATVIVEFWEDHVNDIGIWRSLENYNNKFFGTPLPFSLKTGEKMPGEKINEKRIHYLLWHKYSELIPDIILSPDHIDLNYMAKEVYLFFYNHKKVFHSTNSSVKSFLNTPNQYGWDVKRKLIWLGQHSYLFRHGYEKYIEQNGGEPDISIIDDFICQNSSLWSGLGVIDILASMLNISKRQRKELRSWYERHLAYYQIESIKGPLLIANNLIINKNYVIRAGEHSENFQIGHVYYGSLAPWNKEWYWSGKQWHFGKISAKQIEEIREDSFRKSPGIVYRYNKILLKKAEESIKNHYRNFVNFHGNDLVVFPDGYSVAAAIQKQHHTEFEKQPPEAVSEVMKKYNLKNPWPNYSYPTDFLENENGIGLFFNPDEGMEFMREFNLIESGFQKRGMNLTEDEMEAIRGFIESGEISVHFVMKMVEKYGGESIGETYLIRNRNNTYYLNYILRKYKGDYFRKRYPQLSFRL